MTKKSKVDKIEAAKEIVNLTEWIDGADQELREYGKRSLRIDVKQTTGSYLSYNLQPSKFNATERVSKYYKRLVKEEITAAKKRRTTLIESLTN